MAAVAMAFLAACLPAVAEENAPSRPLRALTTTHEAHALKAHEALQGLPIDLHGVVTYYDPYLDSRHIALFIHDATGSLFVSVPSDSTEATPAGTLVEVRGTSGLGDYAPILADPKIRVLGHSHIPTTAPRVSLTRLLTGAEDGQWIEVEGVVRSVFESEHNITVQIGMADGLVSATTMREAGATYQNLVDAKVQVHANAAPVFNGNHQMVGVRLLFPNLSAMKIVEPGPQSPFELPVSAISSLSKFDASSLLPHRVHLQGRVTLQWPGSLLCLRDATHGLCAQTHEETRFAVGDTVDAVGFVAGGETAPRLSEATFQRVGKGGVVPAERVSAPQALSGKYDAELIEIEGQVVGRDLTASSTTLLLAAGRFVYPVMLPEKARGAADEWENGSWLRVTGICSVLVDTQQSGRAEGEAIAASFRVLLRSPEDLVVVQRPSWWTPRHALLVIAGALTLTMLVLIWVVLLKRRVEEQSKVIRKSEGQFRHIALHDTLTGLPTRMLLRERLDEAIESSKQSGKTIALLMLDLDNFKCVNDTFGHETGDQVLCVTAERIKETVRRSDVTSRISGDEFIVLLTDLVCAKDAEAIAADVVQALSAPLSVRDREMQISVSVGVCTTSGDKLDAEALLRSADTAMYHAKAQGRNGFQVFTDEMAREALKRSRLRIGLERALALDEFELHYQPLVSFNTREVTGFEALLRWRNPELGLVMPAELIGLAEESGLIVPIGEWVLRKACEEIGALERELCRSFLLAVNLSPRQFRQEDLPLAIEQALRDHNRPAGMVELEITEGLLLDRSPKTHSALVRLQESGVRLAIDDFGTGFSSLSYITHLSVDRLKIDRSFVEDCTTHRSSLAVIRAVVAMAHGLGIHVVAEGVETEAQFDLLRREGCEIAQGYYLGRPVPAVSLPALLTLIEEHPKAQAGYRSIDTLAGDEPVSPYLQ